MMNLKTEYDNLLKALTKAGCKLNMDEFQKYIISAMLHIWGSNSLYSDVYRDAINEITGVDYSTEQIVTAMRCCNDGNRTLAIPEFFMQRFNEHLDTGVIGVIISEIDSFLFYAASINGDFTIAECNALDAIIRGLVDYSKSMGVSPIMYKLDGRYEITSPNADSYVKRLDDNPVESSAGKPVDKLSKDKS